MLKKNPYIFSTKNNLCKKLVARGCEIVLEPLIAGNTSSAVFPTTQLTFSHYSFAEKEAKCVYYHAARWSCRPLDSLSIKVSCRVRTRIHGRKTQRKCRTRLDLNLAAWTQTYSVPAGRPPDGGIIGCVGLNLCVVNCFSVFYSQKNKFWIQPGTELHAAPIFDVFFFHFQAFSGYFIIL